MTRKLRLFLDSNVLTGGIVAPWGLDKAVISLCAARVCRLVLAEAVREEVEENLLVHVGGLLPLKPTQGLNGPPDVLEDYRRLIELTRPEVVPFPEVELVRASRGLIRHEADVPVLLSAMEAKPDWLLTHNTKHFTQAVAVRCGVRIATPVEFFETLAGLLK